MKENWLISKPIAHRGLHNSVDAPENSLKAFQNAIAHGLPIELDLNITSDEKIVVFHDNNLNRMAGVNLEIPQNTFSTISKYSLNNTAEKIPLLENILEEVAGKVGLLIEIKNFRKPGRFEEILAEILYKYKGDFAVQSFNPLTVLWFKNNAPNFIRGQIASKFKSEKVPIYYKYLLRYLVFNVAAKPDFINYHIDDLPNFVVNLYKNRQVPILGWTIKNENHLKKAKMHCDNFVFENLETNLVL